MWPDPPVSDGYKAGGGAAARPHERFSRTVTLSPDDVASFARAAGDDNPVHRDPAFAAATRVGGPIASGTQTTALLLGLAASHFSARGAMLGLEFWVRFRRPVPAGDTVMVEWPVVDVRADGRLGGDVVDLRGRVRRGDGVTAVGAKGRVPVTDRL